MATQWNYESGLPPASYSSVFKQDNSQEGWTCVDFFPEVIKPVGVFKAPEYSEFRLLVERANDWLRTNPQCEIKTCETVSFPATGSVIHSEEMIYLEYGEALTVFGVGLRLWISPKKDYNKNCQQIGYLNLVPEVTTPGGIFKSPIYERMDVVVNKFNQKIKYQPIPGRIITIETRKIKVHSNGANPEETTWYRSGTMQNRFLRILTIFYEITDSTYEEIGFQDFYPSVISQGGVFKSPIYEMFCYAVNKASDWCSQQTEIRIFNFQAIDINMDGANRIDPQRMDFTENMSNWTYYLRILRVAYAKSVTDSKLYPTLALPQLKCKSFIPVQISSGVFTQKFETLQQTKARVSAWIKATGAKVLNVETSCVKMNFMGKGPQFHDDTTYTFSVRKKNQFLIYVIRLYLDRYYPEPPEGTLPPVPVLPKSKSNCLIS